VGDPRGTFLAAKAAEPVYELFGERGLRVTQMPPIEPPLVISSGSHAQRQHGLIDEDTEKIHRVCREAPFKD